MQMTNIEKSVLSYSDRETEHLKIIAHKDGERAERAARAFPEYFSETQMPLATAARLSWLGHAIRNEPGFWEYTWEVYRTVFCAAYRAAQVAECNALGGTPVGDEAGRPSIA